MDPRRNVERPRNNCHTPADNEGVSMQLRLVEGPTRTSVRKPAAPKGASPSSKAQGSGRPLKGSVKGSAAKGSRRAVHWADWHLDARTRRVGRAGVAAAKAALEQAARPEPGTGTPLSKAS
jgi:hypothetical protein